MTAKKGARYLRASDLCVGWVFLRLGAGPEQAGQQRVVVCVLPKPWRGGGERRVISELASAQQGTTPREQQARIFWCYQGDVIAFQADDGQTAVDSKGAETREVLAKLFEYVERPDEPSRRQHRDDDDEDSDDDEETADWLDEEQPEAITKRTRRLFGFSRKPAEEGPRREHVNDKSHDPHAALIRLLDRVQPVQWLDCLMFTWEPLFAVSVAKRFVQELAAMAVFMRRGYVERRAVLGTPRGRPVPASAARTEASGEPRLLCDYSDFDLDQPLHRVLVTALSVAVRILYTNAEDHLAQVSAVRLQRQLSGIVAFAPVQARAVAAQLRISRHQQPRWHTLLRLARAVLHSWGPQEQADTVDPTPDIVLPTSSLWEAVITKALNNNGTVTLEDSGAEVPNGPCKERPRRIGPPWKVSGAQSMRADIVVDRGHEASSAEPRYLILDAKFMRHGWDKRQKSPRISVSHLRQLFAYGVLWRDLRSVEAAAQGLKSAEAPAIDVGLVYLHLPRAEGEGANLEPTRLRRAETLAARVPRTNGHGLPGLHVWIMDFPGWDECQTEGGLANYFEATGSTWTNELRQLVSG